MLNSVGESTPPCGTPVLNRRCLDVWFLCCVCFASPNVIFAMKINDCAWNVGM